MRLLGGLGLLAPVAISACWSCPNPPSAVVGRRGIPARSSPRRRRADRRLADRRSSSSATSGSGSAASSRPPSGSPRASSASSSRPRRPRPRGPPRPGDQRDLGRRSPTTTDAATVDKLTGVANRQALLVALFTEVERASRYNRPLSVAFVDIDHFKAVNDTYGHAVGDIVLRGVAQTIKANLRATDLIGRYGGEEFMLLLTETNVEDGAVLAEKLRNLVGRAALRRRGQPEPVGHDLDRHRRRRRRRAPGRRARPRRRRRDVLGQVARPQPDLHLRRARRRRPRAARADLAPPAGRGRSRSAGPPARRRPPR